MKLIEVTWDDHTFYFGEWEGKGFVRITTIGYFVEEDATKVCVALSRRDDGKFSEVQVIDKRTLVKRRWIKEG